MHESVGLLMVLAGFAAWARRYFEVLHPSWLIIVPSAGYFGPCAARVWVALCNVTSGLDIYIALPCVPCAWRSAMDSRRECLFQSVGCAGCILSSQ